MSETVNVAAQKKASSVVEIEFGNARNGNYLFPPTKEVMRGRWVPANLSANNDTPSSELNRVPAHPGMRVRLDVASRSMLAYDPLEKDPELMARVSEANKRLPAPAGQALKPRPSVRKERMTPDELATTLFWMMRAVQSDDAFVTDSSAELPDNEEDILANLKGAKIDKHAFASFRPKEE